MRTSELFTKTSKTVPADEIAKNAQLLIRAGYVYKVMAGVYAYTPLGLRVLENIKRIVREEMEKIGATELIMTTLQDKATWEQTTRWDEKVVDIWFKTKLQDGTEMGLAWSHEEPILEMMRGYLTSYKDLPIKVFQFQTKLRNELRAKSGIMRGREFVMKDMYSLHASAEDLDAFYTQSIEAYKRCYDRLGIGADTYVTFASGGAFTKFSHEFQTVCDAGEDIIYLHREKNIAVNEEVIDDAIKELGVRREELEPVKTAEVGNIFNFGTEKCAQMGIYFTDEKGERRPAYLGSYGIGVTRVMGVLVEKLADDRGLVWPEQVAPFAVHLVHIGEDDKVLEAADGLYGRLQHGGFTVLYDDSDKRPGEKLADADLIGIPHRVVVSAKTMDAGVYEYKHRTAQQPEMLGENQLINRLTQQ